MFRIKKGMAQKKAQPPAISWCMVFMKEDKNSEIDGDWVGSMG